MKHSIWSNESRARLGDDLCASIDRFAPYADQHFFGRLGAFLATTQGTPEANSRWENELCRLLWEMHVGLACLERGLELVPMSRRDCTRGGPDLLVVNGLHRTWIECHVPTDGDEDNKVITIDPDEPSLGDYSEDALLARYARAFKTKADAFRLYRKKGLVGEGDRLVVAIAGDRIRGAQAELPGPPSIVRSVFPLGPMELRWSLGVPDSDQVVYPTRSWIPENGIDDDGGPRRVAQDAFVDIRYAAINAILFSGHQLFCAHDPKAMRFTYVVNPLAKRIRPHRWFKRCIAYQDLGGYLTRTRW
jgi:hypothetical protein